MLRPRPCSTPSPYTTLFRSAIEPGAARPNPNEMTDFNVLTINGKAFPGTAPLVAKLGERVRIRDRKSTRLNSSHLVISYAVFCLKIKKKFASLGFVRMVLEN